MKTEKLIAIKKFDGYIVTSTKWNDLTLRETRENFRNDGYTIMTVIEFEKIYGKH